MFKNYFLKNVSGLGLVVFLLLGAGQVKAQDANPGPKFGVKGGINFSQLYVDQPEAEDENIKVGVNLGVFAKVPITSFLAIQPELLYTSVGSKITYGRSTIANVFGIEPGEVRFNLNYIQLPVALAVNIGPLNVHAGPYLAYLASANIKDLEASDLSSNTIQELDRDDFNTFDYGAVIGVGFDVGNLTLGARYNYGLREVGKEDLAGGLTNDSKNSAAAIYIGFGL